MAANSYGGTAVSETTLVAPGALRIPLLIGRSSGARGLKASIHGYRSFLVEGAVEPARKETIVAEPIYCTPSEFQVLVGAARGESTQAIAEARPSAISSTRCSPGTTWMAVGRGSSHGRSPTVW